MHWTPRTPFWKKDNYREKCPVEWIHNSALWRSGAGWVCRRWRASLNCISQLLSPIWFNWLDTPLIFSFSLIACPRSPALDALLYVSFQSLSASVRNSLCKSVVSNDREDESDATPSCYIQTLLRPAALRIAIIKLKLFHVSQKNV